jgi:hypothetical protein
MGSLSNLYISQSYISLLHLGSDNTASATMTELQDGLGNSISVSVNTQGAISASGISLNNSIVSHRGLEASGTIRFNTSYTSSTPQYVNSGNQFTDNIIRVTGSYASGSLSNPTLNEVQNGWIANGPGISNAIVIANDYVPATGWRFTIDQNTAVWFGSYIFTNPVKNYENLSVSGSQDITGSLWIRDTLSVTDISASGNISASNLWVKNKIHAYELDVTIISSSIVFSSGSNILGDNANEDVQLLIGRTIVTGSLEVTSSIKATNDISSSTLNGVGNVTLYSQSVASRVSALEFFSSSQYKADSSSFDSRLDYLEGTFSTSVDSRLDLVEATASYLNTTFSTSVDLRLDNLENFSSSLVATFATVAQLNASSSTLQSNINTKLDTASFNTYSASAYQTDVTQSINNTIVSASAWGAFQSASAFSASAATTYSKLIGSNTFSGSQVYTGSVRGNVTPITISSNTASIDCSRGSFFTLSLPGGGANTRLEATNILPGETISLRVTCAATTSSVSYPTYIKFPKFSAYSASLVPNAIDIVTFVTYDSTNLFGVNVKNMI